MVIFLFNFNSQYSHNSVSLRSFRVLLHQVHRENRFCFLAKFFRMGDAKEAPPPYYDQQPPLYDEQTPPLPPTQQIVYVTQTTVPLLFGPKPMNVTCPFCQKTMTTTMKIEPNTKTHLFALLLCALGCWPCFWIPYISDGCQSKKHYCRSCKAYLGVYSD